MYFFGSKQTKAHTTMMFTILNTNLCSPFIPIKTLNTHKHFSFFTILNCAQLHTLINGVGRPCLFPLKIMLMVKWIRFHQCCRLMEEATGRLNAQSTSRQNFVSKIFRKSKVSGKHDVRHNLVLCNPCCTRRLSLIDSRFNQYLHGVPYLRKITSTVPT